MNLNQLEILQYLQETGYNVTKVAERMNIVQSAVSRQLLMLEDELGSPLFKRHGKRLIGSTALGNSILEQVATIRQAKRNIRMLADDYLENRNGTLNIATTHTQAKYLLPKPITQFKKKYPDIKIYIEQSSPDNLIHLLHEQKADIAICTEKLDDDPKLVIKPCYQWHHVVIVPHSHPLTHGEITLERLANFPILTYSRGFTGRSNLEKAFAAAGMELDVTLAAADSDVIKTYVRLGLGIGLIAETSLEPGTDYDLSILSLEHLIPHSTTKFAYLKDSYLPAYTHYFIDQLLAASRNNALFSSDNKC
ncbi:LysR substrate-binding domain-containing protein [Methylomarinum sp. Ch1-1]|uniref:LysR substrate-binding domain-containing protein n=1 Tax=Methylomarinum roseum TaxID=3067653 RepID=A0AAU7P011_9GAMM|nr:LysR substrate-binding domain-containing protein [Methylomarinum sp. Ch1-1]MDP4520655.1 LysR substrate-binding domain-containing protein [Methylomarinum sp. Ch1-1]